MRRFLRVPPLEGTVGPADASGAAATASDEALGRARAGRPGALVAALAATWLAAILCARLLLAGGLGWLVFLLLLPILLLALWRLLGLPLAVGVLGLFVAATLGLRALLMAPRLGWGLLLVVPVALVGGYVAWRVAATMRTQRRVD